MRIFIDSYGCTANESDAQKLERLLRRQGHEVVASREEGDAVLLNTCTVVQSTQDRMLHKIRESDEDLIVAGCMAAAQEDLIRDAAPEATVLRSTGVSTLFGEEKLDVETEVEGVTGTVQIAEGCLGDCSYCITKFARGTVRSLHPVMLKKQAASLVEQGAVEIRLTSQDNGAYGADLDTDLVEAVEAVTDLDQDVRVRVGMMNPFTAEAFSDRFDELFGHPAVYDYLHLPLQSGSDAVLERMGREHTADTFRRVVRDYRDARPDGTLFTDVIAGFPGETAEDHRATVRLLEEVRPHGFNITRFSPRPGTEAAEMEELDHDVKKERSKEFHDLRHALGEERYRERVGDRVEVLVTEEGDEGSVIGRDDRYTPVAVQEELELGTRVEVEITGAESTYVLAERT